MKDALIPGYLDTKYMTVLRKEQILHNFEDQKFAAHDTRCICSNRLLD